MRKLFAPALAVTFVAAIAPWTSRASGGCDWPQYGHDKGHSFANSGSCSAISQATVATLHPKWFVNTNSPVTAQPAVADGKLYVGSFGGDFYKVDAASGSVDWHANADVNWDPSYSPFKPAKDAKAAAPNVTDYLVKVAPSKEFDALGKALNGSKKAAR